MNILIISFYYEPDLCAGSFRTTSFVKALQNNLTHNDSVEVITTQPNRYHSYKIRAEHVEKNGNITIRRIEIPSHRGAFLDQARSFLSFFINTLRYVRGRKYDLIFASSSRLFTAFLGAVVSKQKDSPLYLDIRDIFSDAMKSILKDSKLHCAIPLLSMIERFTVNSACKINLVSEGFIPYFQEKYADKTKFSFFTNGIDDEFLCFKADTSPLRRDDKVIFTYTGNIGEGQGLERIVPQIASRYKDIVFCIIGDGGRKKALRESTKTLENVRLIDPVNRTELIKYYEKSDILFLQLNDYDAFKKVLPSKIFEYAATYKPIIAGVDGYAKEFLKECLPDSLVYKPCDINDFSLKYERFRRVVDIDRRKLFIKRFSRNTIMDQMSKDLLKSLSE